MKLFKRLLKYFSRLEKEEIIDLTPIVEDKYNEVAIGNLVWALMPLSDDELERIEESHRIRPYLVVAKDENYFYGYYCSTKQTLIRFRELIFEIFTIGLKLII